MVKVVYKTKIVDIDDCTCGINERFNGCKIVTLFAVEHGYLSDNNRKLWLARFIKDNKIVVSRKKIMINHKFFQKGFVTVLVINYLINNNIEITQRNFEIEKYRMLSRIVYNHDPSMEEIKEAIG